MQLARSQAPRPQTIQLSARWAVVIVESPPGYLALAILLDGAPFHVINAYLGEA